MVMVSIQSRVFVDQNSIFKGWNTAFFWLTSSCLVGWQQTKHILRLKVETSVYLFIYLSIYLSFYIYVYIYITFVKFETYIYRYDYMHIHIYCVWINIYIYMHLIIYIYILIYEYTVHIYIYIYVYIWPHCAIGLHPCHDILGHSLRFRHMPGRSLIYFLAIPDGGNLWNKAKNQNYGEIYGKECTLWLFNIAMENGPFIDGLPIINGDFPWLC